MTILCLGEEIFVASYWNKISYLASGGGGAKSLGMAFFDPENLFSVRWLPH